MKFNLFSKTQSVAKWVWFLALFIGTNITLEGQDIGGLKDKLNPKKWFANMTEGDPFKVAGGVGLSLRNYNSWSPENRQPPFSYTISANTNIGLYKINVPFSLVYTGQNTSASHPFNLDGLKESVKNKFVRVGASPFYKWAKVHLGHRSMNFSTLTYANQTFYGVGTELTPGKFRIAAMRGLMPTAEPVDLSLFEVNQQVFNRRATTVKLGYGDDSKFADVIFMKGADRTDLFSVNADSALVAPQENMVIGFNGQWNLLKNLSAKMEIASSAYSKNSLAPKSDTVGTRTSRILHPDFIMRPNLSTDYNTAINGGWQFQGKGFNLGMDYQRFAPGYKTMGVYYFNDDLQNTTINMGLNFSKIQLSLNLTGGFQTNNLELDKQTTVSRTIGSANATWAKKNFQANATYNNFSNSVEYVLNPTLDSLNAIVITENAALNLSYTLATVSEAKHSFSLAATSQIVNSPNASPATGNNTGTRMYTGNLSYNLKPKEGGYKWTARANYNQNQLSGLTSDRIGFGFGVAKAFLENKINLRVDNNYFITNAGETTQNSLNSSLTGSYKVSKGHSLNLRVMFLNRGKTQAGITNSNTEIVNALQYQYRFQYNPKQAKERKKKEAEESKPKTKK